ncbi:hypothetical protein C8Q74DRAFT_524970 [Fomes fomentarius]|nr:hypothetical protein C8Q74DRAFT_524970 [Fomes fomentarius]
MDQARMVLRPWCHGRASSLAQCIDTERRREDLRVTHRATHRRGEEKRKRSRRVGRGRAASGGRAGQVTRQEQERNSTKTVSTTTEPHRSLVSSLRHSFFCPVSVANSKRMSRLGGHQMHAHGRAARDAHVASRVADPVSSPDLVPSCSSNLGGAFPYEWRRVRSWRRSSERNNLKEVQVDVLSCVCILLPRAVDAGGEEA